MKNPTFKELKNTDFSQLISEDFKKSLKEKKLFFAVKRLVDVVLSLILILIITPFSILLIIIIRLDSKGKAIFKHKRVGKNGKLFTLYKFRTMKKGVNIEEFAPVSLNDQRITKIGKFLRRTSLDELPQLFNVLKGDMSLVGPRPEMKFIVDSYTEIQKVRLLINPGITGFWQVMGRKDIPLNENIEYDLYYIQRISFLMDLKIFMRTIIVVLKGTGAY